MRSLAPGGYPVQKYVHLKTENSNDISKVNDNRKWLKQDLRIFVKLIQFNTDIYSISSVRITTLENSTKEGDRHNDGCNFCDEDYKFFDQAL